MMASDWFSDDDQLFDALTDAANAAGPAPVDVVAAAKAVFTMRSLDAELALATRGSRDDDQSSGTSRPGAVPIRSLVFGSDEITLDIDVLPETLVGQISPAHAGRIVVSSRGDEGVQGEIDEDGMFIVARGAPGEVQFRVEPKDVPGFETQWTLL